MNANDNRLYLRMINMNMRHLVYFIKSNNAMSETLGIHNDYRGWLTS